jgi:hypothetical protein
MSRAPFGFLFTLAAVCALNVPAHGQAVISTHSGVVNFFEGSVAVGGQPLEARLGKFAMVPEGAELRTAQGRAEVLLTPGVFLRVGENSAIRMLATSLADTRVELLAGSALVESGEPATGTSVRLLYKTWTVSQSAKGAYRVDVEPARVAVHEGEVQVAGASGGPVKVEPGMELPLAAVLVPEQANAQTSDGLGQWAQGRAESVAADNAIAAGIQDPAKLGGTDADAASWAAMPADGFTYFPMLGLSSADPALAGYGYSSGLYGPMGPQLGFYSFYLPGYTYRPMLLGLTGLGLGLGTGTRIPGPYLPTLPTRIGGTRYPGTTTGMPVGRPVGARPVTPHPAPHIGGRR